MRVPIGRGLRLRLGPHPDLVATAAELEPGSLAVTSALAGARPPGQRWVACIEGPDRSLRGAVVIVREAPMRWAAHPLLVHPDAAPPLARLVDRSWATSVEGIGTHVQPLVEGLHRAHGSGGRLGWWADPPGDPAALLRLDHRSRAARPDDLDAVLRVFTGYRYQRLPTARSRRRYAERCLATGLSVVAEVDGTVVGATLIGSVGDRFALMDDGMVEQQHRGQGLAWSMVDRVLSLAWARDIGIAGCPVADNPMDPYARGVDPSAEWWYFRLRPRGGPRLTRLRARAWRRAHRGLEERDDRRGRRRRGC